MNGTSTAARTVAITGSTGLVGSALISVLSADGWRVRRLVRREVRDPTTEIRWDPDQKVLDASQLKGVDAVVHLAGEGVADRRWSEEVKREILTSRTEGTRLLCEALAVLDTKPRILCSASAVGYYGDRGDEILDESSASGGGFLADVCREWEAATQPARDAGIRVVNLRMGVVLSEKGGALARMLLPFKAGLGGIIGNGQQYISWITLDDLVRVIQFGLDRQSLSGPVNAVAPNPVTNRDFTKTLGQVLHRPTVLPMPAFAARLAFGEMADEMLLASARVLPAKLQGTDFTFQSPELGKALEQVLHAEG